MITQLKLVLLNCCNLHTAVCTGSTITAAQVMKLSTLHKP